MITEILEHLTEEYPYEGCGLIVNKRGKLTWMPCENTAASDEHFKISAKDYIRASLLGDVHAVVHSHPDASPEPSEHDKKASDYLGIPYHIYSIPSGEYTVYEPAKKREPLLGRDYKFGVNDCYSLVRDYYLEKLGLTLPTIEFEDDFWEYGIDYFNDLQESFGFVEVDQPKEHDLIFFSVMAPIPNHCGIYLGDGIFMHHAADRLSCRESLSSFWGRYITRYVRCKQFI